ncbi:MAG: MotA/TolQ/ExbB proton channel family protein [Rhodoplanes sp.]|uniref:MotA/TolQ/ExbB proton channel family protein n=1 Tax=Rhodoplanes sp. TaxID=1968906 RepID=UPI00182CE521|nr:MotA/TolQ/ExbB proton channel family protein [Rhodoplanes sp.]NVO14646.1 MotA/TolQ/ExbB proton channel family protein [Rhodoplanes sp.]
MDIVTLSPWGLFVQAGPVVKGVMIVLLAASVWCWVVVVESIVVLRRLDGALRAERTAGDDGGPTLLSPVFAPTAAGAATLLAGEPPGEARRRLAETMTRAARTLLADAERGLPNLAVVSSVAPFVGLFGTVWGIMASFAGIAEAKETSLAIVAPGIAEALAATAYGLAAAIPASAAYNWLGTAFARRGRTLATLIEERAAAATSAAPLAAPRR